MALFPTVHTEAEVDAFVADPVAVQRVLDGLSAILSVDGGLVRSPTGSAVVGLGATEVLKVMAPQDADLSATEVHCLGALHGELPIPTPELIDSGEIEGWRWIRMSRLHGVELAPLWPQLSAAERISLGTQLGEGLAVLRGLEPPVEVPRVCWQSWRAERLAGLIERQRPRGCPDFLIDELLAYVEGSDLSEGPTGWLHTEVMREHLLVQPSAGGWRLSGLFDFEPSQVGPVDYEFASVGLFVSAGEPAVLREILRAAGVEASARRLFAMAAMHRYANFGWYYRRLGGPSSVAGLADAWFGQAD